MMNSRSVCRYALCICTAAAMLAGCGGSQPPIGTPGAADARSEKHSQTFSFTGSEQTFKVPAGVTHLTITARGASGARGYGFLFATPPPGGLGGIVIATISVTPRERLAIFVGGGGRAGGFNGGGAVADVRGDLMAAARVEGRVVVLALAEVLPMCAKGVTR